MHMDNPNGTTLGKTDVAVEGIAAEGKPFMWCLWSVCL